MKLLNFLESLYKNEYKFFSDTVQVLIKQNIEVDSYTCALCLRSVYCTVFSYLSIARKSVS